MFPFSKVCKHYAACCILEELEAQGFTISSKLAHDLVAADDEASLAHETVFSGKYTILETGSADWVCVNSQSGFTKNRGTATLFDSLEEFATQCSHDKRYKWLLDRKTFQLDKPLTLSPT